MECQVPHGDIQDDVAASTTPASFPAPPAGAGANAGGSATVGPGAGLSAFMTKEISSW